MIRRFNQLNKEKSQVEQIRNFISSKTGEWTSATTYLFQSYIVKEKAIRETLQEIALDELEHIELLSGLLLDDDVVPYFVDAVNMFWSSKYTNYEVDVRKFLKGNIEGEKGAIAGYLNFLDKCQNEKVKDVINHIVDDEKRHCEILENLLNNLS